MDTNNTINHQAINPTSNDLSDNYSPEEGFSLTKDRIPNFIMFDPDQLVRYFRDHPETYYSMIIKLRNEQRVGPDELMVMKQRFQDQLSLPRQSLDTIEAIQVIINQFDNLVGIYATIDDQPPYTETTYTKVDPKVNARY